MISWNFLEISKKVLGPISGVPARIRSFGDPQGA